MLVRAGGAAEITGVSEDSQRDWRKRGFIPSLNGGHARFDATALAQLILMRKMADACVPLPIASSTARVLAPCLLLVGAGLEDRVWAVVDGERTAPLERMALTIEVSRLGVCVVLNLKAIAAQFVERAEAYFAGQEMMTAGGSAQ